MNSATRLDVDEREELKVHRRNVASAALQKTQTTCIRLTAQRFLKIFYGVALKVERERAVPFRAKTKGDIAWPNSRR